MYSFKMVAFQSCSFFLAQPVFSDKAADMNLWVAAWLCAEVLGRRHKKTSQLWSLMHI